jgi:hypothetical protein
MNYSEVIINLYKEGYRLKDIKSLTNISILRIIKCLKLNKSNY